MAHNLPVTMHGGGGTPPGYLPQAGTPAPTQEGQHAAGVPTQRAHPCPYTHALPTPLPLHPHPA